ncbi:MAG: arginine--tRNA ligase [Methanobrevibacter sp.]|nr:arginine--tRNA ligase [Methanobrevibacter sp.]
MYIEMKNDALNSLKNVFKQLNYEIPENINLEFPPNPKMGDLATTISFQLAKQLKKSPMDITSEIIDKIEISNLFEKVESKGPYINFFINYEMFSKKLLKSIDNSYGQLKNTNKKIVLEHTSANPNGPLHIGHIRNAIIGDSLKRLLICAGNNVHTQYYVNDMGRQIAMIVFGMEKLGLNIDDELAKSYKDNSNNYDSKNENIHKKNDTLPGKNNNSSKSNQNIDNTNTNSSNNYNNLNNNIDFEDKIDHQIGKLYFKVNEKLKEDETLNKEVDSLIKQYEAGENHNLNKIFEKAVDSCLLGTKETLAKLNIKHDDFIWEGQFLRNGDVDKVIDGLKATGYTSEEEVLQLNLEKFGIEKELILRRSDGTSLYSTRDLAYHMKKSQEGDIVLDILGSDHKLAIDQISIALELLNQIAPEVIFYEFITLPEGSMSTRKGVFISVDELIEEAIKRAIFELNERRKDLDKVELEKIAEEIGIGAIRYYISRLSPEKHITFKWDEALSFERGCASIQYAHARATKLLEKSGHFEDNKLDIAIEDIEDNWILNEHEIDLIRTIAKFPLFVEESATIMRVHPIAQYVQDLANSFNKFYKSQAVIGCETELARLLLVDKTRIAIKNALDILGVKAPVKM